MNKPYYFAYEERYQKVFSAGVEHWGHSPNDETLVAVLENWVNDNNLVGKSKNDEVEVWVPLVPARSNSKEGYFEEMKMVGFDVERFVVNPVNEEITQSCSIFVRKP